MYLRLANATFLTNLGPMSNLTNAWSVQYSTSGNITKNTGSFSVTKGGTLTATYTLGSGAEFTSATISPTSAGTVSHSVSGSTVTVTVKNVSANFTLSVVASGSAPVTPTNYTFTINPDPTSATVILSATGYSTVSGTGSKSITVANGTKVNWTVSASGYTTRTGNWTISGGNKTENITLSATSSGDAANTATLTVNPTPNDATVKLYAKGYTQSGNSITVSNDGTINPTYQVCKDNYLSQGGTVAKIKSNQVLDITLQPFSSGNWTDITSTAEKVADYFVVDGSGKFNGPYTSWCHWIVPVTPGKKYRITAAAGQSGRLWGFYADKPKSDGSVKPITVSPNNGITVPKISDEVIAPEGAVYLVVNNRINSTDTKAIIEVLN